MKTKRLTERELQLLRDESIGSTDRQLCKDALAYRRALKKIEKKAVNYGLSAGFTETIWTIAKRALGEA